VKIADIYEILDEIAPFELAEKWDNAGVLIGSKSDEFDKIYLSIDIDSNLADSVEENSLVIVHHPLIFDGLKSLNHDRFPSNIIYKLIKKDIKVIAMHTNADKSFLNRFLVKDVLGYSIISCNEYECYFEPNKSFDEFALEVAKKLDIEYLRVVKTKEFIKRASLCSGGGGSLLNSIDADCYLTGDIKYHTALEANENKISLIDIEHYQSEAVFPQALKNLLENKGINAIIANSKNPFRTIKGK
jgi:dinuclear metal center YbgI/SA1388 family protein